jgi:hypothetical protein
MPWRRRDTITTPDSLAFSRSRYNAHEFRTSQAECRGFESRLPLQTSVAALLADDHERLQSGQRAVRPRSRQLGLRPSARITSG